MPPESPKIGPRRRGWLMLAGALHVVAMLLVMSALARLTPLTMTFSIGGAGSLLVLSGAIYVACVAIDLRRGRLL